MVKVSIAENMIIQNAHPAGDQVLKDQGNREQTFIISQRCASFSFLCR